MKTVDEKPSRFKHAVMVMISVDAESQEEAQDIVASVLGDMALYRNFDALENVRVVIPPRKGWPVYGREE